MGAQAVDVVGRIGIFPLNSGYGVAFAAWELSVYKCHARNSAVLWLAKVAAASL